MKEKKKIVPPVIEKKPEEFEPEIDQIEVPAPVIEEKQPEPEERLALLEKNMEEANQNFKFFQNFIEKMSPLIALSEKIAQQQEQPAPPAMPQQLPQTVPAANGKFNINSILEMLPAIAPLLNQGAGAADTEFATLGKELIREQIAMSRSITNAVVAKITSKAAGDVAGAITT